MIMIWNGQTMSILVGKMKVKIGILEAKLSS